MSEITFFVKAFIALFVLVNPLEGIPIFLSVASKVEPPVRVSIARRASLTVGVILVLAALLGREILQLFGVTIGAFQLGGGVILFLVSVRMVLGGGSHVQAAQPLDVEAGLAFAIVPLAIPLMAGPGAITGAILYGTRMRSYLLMGVLVGIIVLVAATTYASLRGAQFLARYLKETGISVATSVMGLIIAAVAVEMMAQGVASLFGLKLPGGG